MKDAIIVLGITGIHNENGGANDGMPKFRDGGQDCNLLLAVTAEERYQVTHRAVFTHQHRLTTLPTWRLVSKVFQILQTSLGPEKSSSRAFFLSLKTAVCARGEAVQQSTRSSVPTAAAAICPGRRRGPEDAPCCSRRRIHTYPARAPRGDPDMTRRLPDRAHVRRQGQTRCSVGRHLSKEQLTDLTPATVLNPLWSLAEPQVSERTNIANYNTALSCSYSRSCPAPHVTPHSIPVESADQCSPSSVISKSSVPILESSSREVFSCSSRLTYCACQHRLKDLARHSTTCLQDNTCTFSENCYFDSCTPFGTERKTAHTAKRLHRSHFDPQVSRPCDEQSWATVKHRRLRFIPTSLLLLYFLLLLPKSLEAKPASTIEREGPNDLILKTPLCKPVSDEDLQKMMGTFFDPNRMAVPTAKRNRPANFVDHSSASGFQGDDPQANRVSSSDPLVQEEILWSSEEDSEWEDDDDDDDEVVSNERVWIKEKEVVEGIYNGGEEREETIEEEEEIIVDPYSSRHSGTPEPPGKHSGKYKHKHRQHRTDVSDTREHYPSRHRISTDSYAYMKRRRRRRSSPKSWHRDALSRRSEYVNSKNNVSNHGFSSNSSNNVWAGSNNSKGAKRNGRYVGSIRKRQTKAARNPEDVDDYDKRDTGKRSDISLLPLKITMTQSKEQRKSLKKKFRQNAKFLKRRRPPWQCEMTTKTLLMKDGVFPRVLVEGHCGVKRKCFYRLYNCEPQRYNIRLMERDPNHCNPLPTLGNATVYEERWTLVNRAITVGCNCVNAPVKRRKQNNRWRSGRKKKIR
ncbi:protein trunk [Elysia marginata]|uniref:Protein trunk n=1 Tax=Elysia marginata TaxID=1093978 RepID=A0AAV4FR76_9GAST|nr:protein trunk [Elysia marginata]